MSNTRRIDNRELIEEATKKLEDKLISKDLNLKRLKDNKLK